MLKNHNFKLFFGNTAETVDLNNPDEAWIQELPEDSKYRYLKEELRGKTISDKDVESNQANNQNGLAQGPKISNLRGFAQGPKNNENGPQGPEQSSSATHPRGAITPEAQAELAKIEASGKSGEVQDETSDIRKFFNKWFGKEFVDGIMAILGQFTAPIPRDQIAPGLMSMAFSSPEIPRSLNDNTNNKGEKATQIIKNFSQLNIKPSSLGLNQSTNSKNKGIYYSNSYLQNGKDTYGRQTPIEKRIEEVMANLGNSGIGGNSAGVMERLTKGKNYNLFNQGQTALLHTSGDAGTIDKILEGFNASSASKYQEYVSLGSQLANLPPQPSRDDPEYAKKMKEWNQIKSGVENRPDGLDHQSDIREPFAVYQEYFGNLKNSPELNQTRVSLNVRQYIPGILNNSDGLSQNTRTQMALAHLNSIVKSGKPGTVIISKGDIYFMPDKSRI